MAMKRVLGYLAVLEGYGDANWITGSNEVKSISGYVFTIGGRAVSCKSSKQTCIARSTMESEFIALDKAGEEVEWLRNFLEDIPYWPKPVAPLCIHCDSQAAIGRARSMMYNDYVKSKDNMSDSLTKGLSREGVERTSKGMGLRPRTSQHDENLGFGNSDDVLPIYVGDDRTDEDAFKVLRKRRQGFPIIVSANPKDTNALYSLREPKQVMEFLLGLMVLEQ
ncbi:hypothetical protein FXO38_33432 [Capsicum annuum]|nr:hypothetical protein FXO38_33432 [Capsicum annuum]